MGLRKEDIGKQEELGILLFGRRSMEEFGEMRICIVGYDTFEQVIDAVTKAGIEVNPVNPANNGKLGNFKTLTIFCRIPEKEIIVKRRAFMDYISKDGSGLMGLYEHGDWMKVYIFKRLAWT